MATTTNPQLNLIPSNYSIIDSFYQNLMRDYGQYLHKGMEILLIIVLVVYTIIALMAIKQISLMTRTLKSDTNKYIYLIGYLHLIAVLICLVIAIVSL